MTARRSCKRWRSLGFLALALVVGSCAPAEQRAEDELPAMLTLVSPGPPLGLNYGESALLELGYTLRGKPKAGVTLHLSTDGDDGGATLSTATVVTNDRGQASARLTAGAAESAFHVLVTVPQAAELVIDVAVSRYDFGRLLVTLDTRELTPPAVTIEAGAYIEKGCAELPPTAKLMGALRSMQAVAQPGELFFAKLLLHDYTVVGRAVDRRGRLIAQGCVGLPERLLKSGVVVPLAIPLQPVFISPVGSFLVKSELQLHLPEPLYATLACRYGLAQTLIDELLAAVPSVVYGLWGIFVVIPAIRPLANWLHEYLGWFPLFGTSLSGPGLLPAAPTRSAPVPVLGKHHGPLPSGLSRTDRHSASRPRSLPPLVALRRTGPFGHATRKAWPGAARPRRGHRLSRRPTCAQSGHPEQRIPPRRWSGTDGRSPGR